MAVPLQGAAAKPAGGERWRSVFGAMLMCAVCWLGAHELYASQLTASRVPDASLRAPLPLVRGPTHIPFTRRWGQLQAIRHRALEIQEDVYRILGLDTSGKETRESGSSVGAQQVVYAMEAQNVSTVCEIGFFRGVGAANFLAACELSGCTYQSFEWQYIEPVLDYFRETFGERFVPHAGDSMETIPAADIPGGCDIIHVDGSHSYPVPLEDLRNMRAHAKCDHLVLMDDTFHCPGVKGPETAAEKGVCWENCNDSCNCNERGVCNDCSRSYWEAVEEDLLEHYECFFLGTSNGYGKGWCVGRFKNPGACKSV